MLYKFFIMLFLLAPVFNISFSQTENKMDSVSDITVNDADGNEIKLSEYSGKVLLIVNVASKCGFTDQYEGLQEIYTEFKDKGFEVLAFPCNDFGKQEPGTNKEIKEFCSGNYGVTFTLFDKVKILGDDKSPLYSRLTNNESTGKGDVKWNFEKFIISKRGKIVGRFPSKVEPTDSKIKAAIEEQLKLESL